MTIKPTVLVVEDEAALTAMLRYNFEREGFRVLEANDGEEAIVSVAENKPDLILLDWMLPHLSGIDLCRQLRRGSGTRDIPIIIVTARGEEADRIRGLNTGADDYVTKPFGARELLARVEALGRRARSAPSAPEVLEIDGCRFDLGRLEMKRGKVALSLTPREGGLLRFLHLHRARAVSRAELLEQVWGAPGDLETRTVDMTVANLRQKIEKDPAEPRIVVSVKGAGYAWGTR